MVEKKQMRIELTGAEAEKIVSDWVATRMAEQGYKLEYSRNEDGPWPDTFWRGDEVPNAPGKPTAANELNEGENA